MLYVPYPLLSGREMTLQASPSPEGHADMPVIVHEIPVRSLPYSERLRVLRYWPMSIAKLESQ